MLPVGDARALAAFAGREAATSAGGVRLPTNRHARRLAHDHSPWEVAGVAEQRVHRRPVPEKRPA